MIVQPPTAGGNEVVDYAASRRLESQLAAPVSVHWQNVPLRQAVERIAVSQQLHIWIDRRVDPSVPVTLSLQQVPVEQVVAQLVLEAGAGYVTTGDLVYVGPESIVRDLRTLLAISDAQVVQLPPAARRHSTRRTSLAVDRLDEPRKLVERLASDMGVQLHGADEIPHDLWPVQNLPPMSTAQQLTVLLAGFDLQWQVVDAGGAIRIVPLERPVGIQRAYGRQQAAQWPQGLLERDTVRPGPGGGQVTVTARVEVHAQLVGGAEPRQVRPRTKPGRQVYTLKVDQQPVGAILKQLARQLGQELDLAPELTDTAALNARVSFEVTQADLNELLQSVCEPAGLHATSDGNVIRVTAATKR